MNIGCSSILKKIFCLGFDDDFSFQCGSRFLNLFLRIVLLL